MGDAAPFADEGPAPNACASFSVPPPFCAHRFCARSGLPSLSPPLHPCAPRLLTAARPVAPDESSAAAARTARKAPAYSFGVPHSQNEFISRQHEVVKFGQTSPPPGTYDAPSGLDKPRSHVFSFGNADRTERAKFISSEHTAENFGTQSPGPAHSGSTPRRYIGSQTGVLFGSQPQRPNIRKTYEAGPGSHEIDRGMGANAHAHHNPPKYSFGGAPPVSDPKGGKAARTPRGRFEDTRVFTSHSNDFARDKLGSETVGPNSSHASFGGDWDHPDPEGNGYNRVQSVTGKMKSPRYTFSKAQRMPDNPASSITPGPGTYDRGDYNKELSSTDLMGTTVSALASTHTISSSSAMFAQAERFKDQNKMPFLSSSVRP